MMEIESIALKGNKVLQSYFEDQQFIHTFFDYENNETSYKERLKELKMRSFQREKLSATIRSFMEPFGISEQAEVHLTEMKENGVVVIGGQQAGILTGPLYSVHKAITVILLAKQKRKELGVPVIPVFWVAGEDHDLAEINHVYTELNGKAIKQQYEEKFVLKWMASDAEYDQQQMTTYLQEVFKKFGETEYTKDLLQDVLFAAQQEKTFTQFFVRLMNGFFQEEGLLFIDSAYKTLRQIESPYFRQMIEGAAAISSSIVQKEEEYCNFGFSQPLYAEEAAANLFYVHETGRVLLSIKDGKFVNEQIGFRKTEKEMLEIAQNEPWLLSNNVATRPIMQDLIFPVLSFVGGPGEIAYWALLKEAFHHFDIKMPIITPRMSITLITSKATQALSDVSLTVEDVLQGRVAEERDRFIETLKNERFDKMVQKMEKDLEEQYKILTSEVSDGLLPIVEKNLDYHKKQFEFLRNKAEDELLRKHETALRKYQLLDGQLYVDGSLQERIYTPYSFMNTYGPDLIKNLLQLPFEMNGKHQIVYL